MWCYYLGVQQIANARVTRQVAYMLCLPLYWHVARKWAPGPQPEHFEFGGVVILCLSHHGMRLLHQKCFEACYVACIAGGAWRVEA